MYDVDVAQEPKDTSQENGEPLDVRGEYEDTLPSEVEAEDNNDVERDEWTRRGHYHQPEVRENLTVQCEGIKTK